MAQISTSSLAYALGSGSFKFLGSAVPTRPTVGSFNLPHYDFISFLAIAQQAKADFLPTTWTPALNGLGVDGSEQIDQSSLNITLGFSFKQFKLDSREAREIHLEDLDSFSYKALITEILVLQHPGIREHPNIVDLYGISWDVQIGKSGKLINVLPVLVFKKPKHGSLAEFIGSQNYQSLSFDKRLSLCEHIGMAIETMHSCNIVHGDIKPENILVFEDDNSGFIAKVIDFGYSCLGCTNEDLVRLPITPDWSAPECNSGELTISQAKKADMYSYGKLCSWILFGDRESMCTTASKDSPIDIRNSFLSLYSKETLSPVSSAEIVRERLENFFKSCLEADPGQRAGDIRTLVDLISQTLQDNRAQDIGHKVAKFDTSMKFEGLKDVPNLVLDFEVFQHVHCFVRTHIVKELTKRATCTCEHTSCHQESSFQLALCHELSFGTPRDSNFALECLLKCDKDPVVLSKATQEILALKSNTKNAFSEQIDQLNEEYIQTGVLSEAMGIYQYEIAGKTNIRAPLSLTLQNFVAFMLFDQGLIEEAVKMQRHVLDMRTSSLGDENPNTIIAMQRLAYLLSRQGLEQALEVDIQKKVLEKIEQILGLTHLATLTAAWNLATILQDKDELEKSVAVLRQISENIARTLGEGHSQSLIAMDLLATTLRRQGRVDEALKINQKILDLKTKALGKRHPETITAMSSKALSLYHQGSTEESLKIHSQVLEMCQQVLGDENPETIRAMGNIANTLKGQGQLEQAVKFEEQAMATITKILGEYHPKAIIAMNCLAGTYRNLGLIDGTIKIQRRILELQTKALGKEHPSTIAAMETLIEALLSQNEFKEASEIQQRLLDIKIKILGEEHPSTIAAMNNVGFMLTRQDKVDEAIKIQRRVLEMTAKVLGEEHPDNIPVMINMVQTLVDNGHMDEAVDVQRKVVVLRGKVFGKEHPDTLMQMNDLAYMLAVQGRLDQAIDIQKQVLETSRRIFGEEHPNTLSSMANTASILRKQGRADEALAIQTQILDLTAKSVGENHEDTLRAMETLVITLRSQNKVEKALEVQRRIVKARASIFGEQHPATFEAMEYLSQFLAKQSLLEEASEAQKKVVDLRTKASGKENPETLTAMSNYAYLLARRNQTSEAAKIQQQVVDMMEKILGKEHPETIDAKGNLDFMRAAQTQKN